MERYREHKGKDTLLSLAQCPHPPAPIDLAKKQVAIGYYSSVEKHAAPQACRASSVGSNLGGVFCCFPRKNGDFLGDRGPLGPRANGQVPPFEIEILN